MRTIEGRMYAMLDYAHLPRTLWGEAALTAGYLFNRSESRALPPGKTPYEMLNRTQPTLTHLWIFSARCFARIPSELQEKLGPQSREAIFMGYPPGVKAWRCRDIATGIFFNSRDIIFDESFSNRPFPDSDDDDDDDSPAPSRPVAPAAPVPVQTAPAPPPARRSSHIPVLTAKGESYKKRLTADQARLARQREI